MRVLQQELVVLQTLGSGASYDGGDGPPLGGHQLGQVEQLLLLLPRPLGLLDAGLQPFIPTHKANTQAFNTLTVDNIHTFGTQKQTKV